MTTPEKYLFFIGMGLLLLPEKYLFFIGMGLLLLMIVATIFAPQG